MRERRWVATVARAACALVLALGGGVLIVTALPFVDGATMGDAVGPIVVGVALIGIAVLLAGQRIGDRFHTWRDVRRGLRQIETVLRLEAALATRRVPVTAHAQGCPRCGAAAGPNGPQCGCPRA
jgi:hypothetical protein